MSQLILVDGNNLGFAKMAGPRLTAGEKHTNSTFQVIRTIRRLFLDNPKALIMVLWDGRSWRKDMFTEYKANREASTTQIEARKEYYKQQNDIYRGLQMLGVMQCKASNMEADDLAEIFSKGWTGNKVTLLSGDKDWLQLVDERTTWVDPILNRQCTITNFEAFTNCKSVEQFIETKCILGDSGDNIKGIHNVGPKTLQKVYSVWPNFLTFLHDENKESKWNEQIGGNIPSCLKLNILDVMDVLSRNESLMSLATISRPLPLNLKKDRQDLDAESFKMFCYENAFLSYLKDYDKFLQPFKENIYVRVREVSKTS